MDRRDDGIGKASTSGERNALVVEQQRSLVLRVADETPVEARQALVAWLSTLLDIRASRLSTGAKLRRTLAATASLKLIWPVIKALARHIKRFGWDERSSPARWAFMASGLALGLFGGQAAGLAALGTAVSVPLWVVFGAGAGFARMLIEHLRNQGVAPGAETIVNTLKDVDGIHRF